MLADRRRAQEQSPWIQAKNAEQKKIKESFILTHIYIEGLAIIIGW